MSKLQTSGPCIDTSDPSGLSDDRNLFFTKEECSCNVPNTARGERKSLKEPSKTERENAAMKMLDTDTSEAAASDEIGHYLIYVANLDLPLSAKIEMIAAMRQIMASFVDSAFGDDPVQHVDQLHARDEKRIPAVVSWDNTPPDTKVSPSSASASPASGKRKKERP